MTNDDYTDIKEEHSNDYCKSWLDSAWTVISASTAYPLQTEFTNSHSHISLVCLLNIRGGKGPPAATICDRLKVNTHILLSTTAVSKCISKYVSKWIDKTRQQGCK